MFLNALKSIMINASEIIGELLENLEKRNPRGFDRAMSKAEGF